MIKVALDSSCLNVKNSNPILNKLEILEKELKIKLITSTVNEREQLATNQSTSWKKKYLEKINQKQKIYEVARIGVSKFGESLIGSEACIQLEKLFPNTKDFFDLWLLQTAITFKCDYFLTLNTKDFINNGQKEKIETLGIKIRVPNYDFLDEIEKII